MIKIGIVGGTGYTGVELLRLLAQHPEADVRAITSRKDAGTRVAQMFPSLRGRYDLAFSDPKDADLAAAATSCSSPRRTAWRWRRRASSSAPACGSSTLPPISGSPIRRCSSAGTRCRTRVPTCSPEAVYGIPEINREAIRKARIVGNPGCYPTAVQLGFLPLIEAGLVDTRYLIADCKSGVSGAGRKAELSLSFAEAADNFAAYGDRRSSPPAGDRPGTEPREQGTGPPRRSRRT